MQFEQLSALLDENLGAVGLTRWCESLEPGNALRAPTGAKAWLGHHAVVLVIPASPADWRELASTGAGWLADVLDAWWPQGRLLDAYLLLAFDGRPSGEDLEVALYELEQETAICRRHVLWPDDEGSWQPSLDEVTVSAIPAADRIEVDLDEDALPEPARWVLQRFGELTHATRVWDEVEGRIAEEAAASSPLECAHVD